MDDKTEKEAILKELRGSVKSDNPSNVSIKKTLVNVLIEKHLTN